MEEIKKEKLQEEELKDVAGGTAEGGPQLVCPKCGGTKFTTITRSIQGAPFGRVRVCAACHTVLRRP